MAESPWSSLSNLVDTRKNPDDIAPEAADNILLAWPPMLKAIHALQPHPQGLKALDFGCGTGGLCHKLSTQGYSVVGVDTSSGMLEKAKQQLPSLTFSPTLPTSATFNLITSVMVFQFIEDIHSTLNALNALLQPGGVLAFAVFNPEFMYRNSGPDKLFQHISPTSAHGTMIPAFKIPVVARSFDEYNTLLPHLNYTLVLKAEPPFTEDFLAKYPFEDDTSAPEFLVCVYQKTA